MNAMGTKNGFPDLILPVPSSGYNGLAIEMKSERGRVSPEQTEWIAHLLSIGWHVKVLRSAEEARTELCAYFHVCPDDTLPLDP